MKLQLQRILHQNLTLRAQQCAIGQMFGTTCTKSKTSMELIRFRKLSLSA
jgi:hypothetical protein